MDSLIRNLEDARERKKTGAIVVVAEGDEEGGAYAIAAKVKERFSYYETKVAILGHIQRGGPPTCNDRVLASRLGIAAVDALTNGHYGVMCGIVHFDVVHTPFENAIKYHSGISPILASIAETLTS